MELWNDFEGKTVDGRFHLDHLIGPKGRSAYFTTKDETGAPATIRLIESLNDEEEILTRWRMVTGMKQEHLLEVLASGQTVLDGTHLVYAVMEPTDMELSEVLRERALTTEETKQIALSVADGLLALHAKGLVHQHVEAENVLARGESIKLRSDVVREIPEGAEGAALKNRDVRELSLLLSQCLTRSQRFGETRLPVPFEEVVRKGESGAWGLGSMIAALQPPGSVGAEARAAANGRPAPNGMPASGVATGGVVEARGQIMPTSSPASNGSGAGSGVGARRRAMEGTSADGLGGPTGLVRPVPGVTPGAAGQGVSGAGAGSVAGAVMAGEAAASGAPGTVASRLTNQDVSSGDGVAAHLRSPRVPDRIVVDTEEEPKRWGLLIAVVAGVLLLVVLGIYFLRSARAGQTTSVVQDTPTAVTSPQQSSEDRPPARDSASAPVPQKLNKPLVGAGARPVASAGAGPVVTGVTAPSESSQWRVVAYTYNREAQAAQKAQTIGAKHPGLKPEVFSPSGRAPYLVTLGGWMSADRAAALKGRARSEGIARDVYAQNYRGKGR